MAGRFKKVAAIQKCKMREGTRALPRGVARAWGPAERAAACLRSPDISAARSPARAFQGPRCEAQSGNFFFSKERSQFRSPASFPLLPRPSAASPFAAAARAGSQMDIVWEDFIGVASVRDNKGKEEKKVLPSCTMLQGRTARSYPLQPRAYSPPLG